MKGAKLVLLVVVSLAIVVALLLTYLQTSGEAPRLEGRYFLVDVAGERFIVYVTDSEAIRLAEENLRGLNNMFPTGRLARGDGGFNKPWSWHLVPRSVRMVEVSIELCDGLPSHVEGDLDYWLENVGQYCPWGGRIVASADSLDTLLEMASNK